MQPNSQAARWLCSTGYLWVGKVLLFSLGGAGQFIGEKFGKTELEGRSLVSAGASVGLAAAFNAPLSGVLFALEELYHNFSSIVIIVCTMSAIVGDLLSKLLFGFSPIFSISIANTLLFKHYFLLLILGF